MLLLLYIVSLSYFKKCNFLAAPFSETPLMYSLASFSCVMNVSELQSKGWYDIGVEEIERWLIDHVWSLQA